jgi:hypothetical protein
MTADDASLVMNRTILFTVGWNLGVAANRKSR